MSDFPTNADIPAIRAWLDAKGFENVFEDWTAEMILHVERGDFDAETAEAKIEAKAGRKLWTILNVARNSGAPTQPQAGKYYSQ